MAEVATTATTTLRRPLRHELCLMGTTVGLGNRVTRRLPTLGLFSLDRTEVGEGVWTAKVAKAYGHMLREMKRRREAEEGGRA